MFTVNAALAIFRFVAGHLNAAIKAHQVKADAHLKEAESAMAKAKFHKDEVVRGVAARAKINDLLSI